MKKYEPQLIGLVQLHVYCYFGLGADSDSPHFVARMSGQLGMWRSARKCQPREAKAGKKLGKSLEISIRGQVRLVQPLNRSSRGSMG